VTDKKEKEPSLFLLVYIWHAHRAHKKMPTILAWENSKKAAVEAKLRTREVCMCGIT
jgi:hypothetical protein